MRDAQLGGVRLAQAEAWARDNGKSVAQGFEVLGKLHDYLAERRAADPFLHGYEPPIWTVASALLKDSPVTDSMRRNVRKRTGLEWEAFAPAMRRACGFDAPVDELLVMGANRSGKTDWAAKLAVARLLKEPNLIVTIGAQTVATSRKTQQSRVWHYLPEDLRKRNNTKTESLYLVYKSQNGFTNNKVTLGNLSAADFISYEQDVNAIMEGPAFNLLWLDEEFTKQWLDAGRMRLASTRGALILTFTPVSGYTPVVADYLDGMQVTRETVAYMLPKDGGPPLPWAQLGLTKAEYAELKDYAEGRRETCSVPESRPEDCFAWLGSEPFSEPETVAPGRVFECVPRVARKRDGKAAILWFLGRDNPYGMPSQVIDAAQRNRKATEEIRKRVYGLAKRLAGRRFATFSKALHVVPASAVPTHLARTFVCDPAPERNWFFLWMGVDARGDVWVYREWPGADEIPGIGVPGPWAEVSSKKQGVNDGDRGDAQEKFGFGLDRYKYEWARLEGWADYVAWSGGGNGEETPPREELERWRSSNGTREPLRRRILDSRAGSQSKIGMSEDRTLYDLCCELDDGFEPASGKRISSGEELINALLNPTHGGQRLFVSERCKNTIFALSYYTGADGQRGACKEPIDCLRYGLESGMLEDRPDAEDEAFGGDGMSTSQEHNSEDGEQAELDFDW